MALAGLVGLGGWALVDGAGPAGAAPTTTTAAANSPVRALLPPSYLKDVGFVTDVEGPTATTASPTTGCPVAAGEVFVNATDTVSIGSEIVLCRSVKAATTLRRTSLSAGQAWPGLTAPAVLGPTGSERLGSKSTYAIFWQRRYAVEVVALDTSVGGTGGVVPLTAHQQAQLVQAARVQFARLRVS
jgi:hypothetical protein